MGESQSSIIKTWMGRIYSHPKTSVDVRGGAPGRCQGRFVMKHNKIVFVLLSFLIVFLIANLPQAEEVDWIFNATDVYSFQNLSNFKLGSEFIFLSHSPKFLYKLDKANGSLVWKRDYLNYNVLNFAPNLIVYDFEIENLIVIGSSDFLRGINKESGKSIWYFKDIILDNRAVSNFGEILFAGTACGLIYKIDATNGETIDEYKMKDSVYNIIPVSESKILVVSYKFIERMPGGLLSMVDLQERKIKWTHKLDRYKSQVLLSKTKLIISQFESEIYSIDTFTGIRDWYQEIGNKTKRMNRNNKVPFLSWENSIFCTGNEENKIYSLESSTGKEIWNMQIEEIQHLQIYNDNLYITDSNYIYKLDPKTGNVKRKINNKFHFDYQLIEEGRIYGIKNKKMIKFGL
jgi:outer membrane protein assembly factor BamB